MKIANRIVDNILGKKKKGKDTDGDGVFDEDDCQPKNTMRQDVISQMGPSRLKQMRAKTQPVPPEQMTAKQKEKAKIQSKIY